MDMPEILQYCGEYAPRVGGFLFLNQLAYPLCGMLRSTIRDSEIKVDDIGIESLDSVVDELDVRDFVNLANSLAYQHGKKHHVCRHYAEATMDVYERLIAKWDRPNLSGAVRLVATDDKPKNGHMWLEILEDEEWTPYESFNGTSKLTGATVKEYSRRSKKRKSRINGVENPVNVAHFRGIPRQSFMLPTRKAVFYPGGTGGFFLKMLKDMFKEWHES